VRDRLAAAGITVVPQYGVGGYRVDFAAMHPEDPGRMVLAIEADGATYWQSGSVRDRDRLRGEHLQRLGWRYHRLWSTNWFGDPDAEVAKVRDAYSRAVSRPGSHPAPEAGDESLSGAATSAGASRGAGSAGPSRAGASDMTSRSLQPATTDLTPATRDLTPASGQLAPATRDLTPATGHLAPATRDLAPVPMQTNQVAPRGDSGES